MLIVLRPYNEVDGGIGNYLFHLCHSILYAKDRSATLVVPRPMALATMNSSAIALDYSSKPSPSYRRPRWWDGQSPIERVPYSYDPSKIEVVSGLLHGNDTTHQIDFAGKYHCMQEDVRPLFQPQVDHRQLDDDTLAIHVRSGDIFEPEPNGKYGQPPLSWYEWLIERSGYRKVVIVAQTRFSVGFENPVLAEIRRRWPHVETISESPEHDFHTLRHARHLALSTGTFAVAAAMLNTRLARLHVPRYARIRDENFTDIFPAEADLGFECIDYTIKRYEQMYSWQNTPEQIRLMLEHSVDDIGVRAAGADKRSWKSPKVRS